jgi:hypothetical protein
MIYTYFTGHDADFIELTSLFLQDTITVDGLQRRSAIMPTHASDRAGGRRQLALEGYWDGFAQTIRATLQQGQSKEAVQLIGVLATEAQTQWKGGRLSDGATSNVAQVLVAGLVQVRTLVENLIPPNKRVYVCLFIVAVE